MIGSINLVRSPDKRRHDLGVYPVEWLFLRSRYGFQFLDYTREWFLHNDRINVDVYIDPNSLQVGQSNRFIIKLSLKLLEAYRVSFCQLGISYCPDFFLINNFRPIREEKTFFSIAPLKLLALMGISLPGELIEKLSITLRKEIRRAEHLAIGTEEERIVWTLSDLDFNSIQQFDIELIYLEDAYKKGWRFLPLGIGVFVELCHKWRIAKKKTYIAFDYVFDEVLPDTWSEVHPSFPHSINLRNAKKRVSIGDNIGPFSLGIAR